MTDISVVIPTKKRGRRSWLDIPGNPERLALMYQSMTAEEIGRAIGHSARSVERMIAKLRAKSAPESAPISEQAPDQVGQAAEAKHGAENTGKESAA